MREVLDFVDRRYRGFLIDSGFRYDMVDAVLAERGYDPYLAYRTLEEFAPWVERDDWERLLDAYARCVRITRDQPATYPVERERLVEPAAVALYDAYRRAQVQVHQSNTIDALLGALVELQPYIAKFFDEVLVMAKEPELRENRLGLLQAISALTEGIVDLTQMEGF